MSHTGRGLILRLKCIAVVGATLSINFTHYLNLKKCLESISAKLLYEHN